MIPDFSDKEAFPGVLGWRKQGAWRLVRMSAPSGTDAVRPFYGLLATADRGNESIRPMSEIIIFRTFDQILAIKLLKTPDQTIG